MEVRFDPSALVALPVPEMRECFDPDRAILYALGTGAGLDPVDQRDLAFVDERRLRVIPTFACVLGYEGFWLEREPTGVDVAQALHGEQEITILRPLPAAGEIVRETRVLDVIDRGASRGAHVLVRETIRDATSREVYAELRSTVICRAEGGLGGTRDRAVETYPVPDRAPDRTERFATSPQQALVYRQSGDRNPLHIDPDAARAAGFERPILHGLSTFGLACRSLLLMLHEGDPAGFRSMRARFTGPVFPGEVLEIELWDEPGGTAFRMRAPARAAPVLDHGRFVYGEA